MQQGLVEAQSATAAQHGVVALVEHVDGLGFEIAFAFVHAAVKQHLQYLGYVVGGAEHPCMAGDAAHGVGVLVVHHTAHEAVTVVLVEFGGCYHVAVDAVLSGVVEGVAQPHGGVEVALDKDVEPLTADLLHQLSQEDEAQVAVDVLRLGQQGCGGHLLDNAAQRVVGGRGFFPVGVE